MNNNHRITLLAAIALLAITGCARRETRLTGIPGPHAILALAEKTQFKSNAVTDAPVPEQIARLNPRFAISAYFVADMIKLDPSLGAIAAKVNLKSVAERYNIPDGTYYLWIGRIGNATRAALTRIDGTIQREVTITELGNSYEMAKQAELDLHKIKAAIHTPEHPTEAIMQIHPPPPPPPRRTCRKITQRVCYNCDGKQCWTVTQVWVPDN